MKVFILVRTEPIPETRIDHGCYSHEILGVFSTEELAEQRIETYKEEHLLEFIQGEKPSMTREEYLEEYGHPDDPDREVEFDISEHEVVE